MEEGTIRSFWQASQAESGTRLDDGAVGEILAVTWGAILLSSKIRDNRKACIYSLAVEYEPPTSSPSPKTFTYALPAEELGNKADLTGLGCMCFVSKLLCTHLL